MSPKYISVVCRPHRRRGVVLMLICPSSAMCNGVFPNFLRFSDACNDILDAVVVWDWLISLHREWQFVRLFSPFVAVADDVVPDLEDSLDSSQDCLSFLQVGRRPVCPNDSVTYADRYWVLAMIPYLLYCFVLDHSLETCQKIYKVSNEYMRFLSSFDPLQIPVALAMWNQVGSECKPTVAQYSSCSFDIPAVLLIRTYAFFNRNIYVLWFLISAMSGMVAYQLYVDTSQMLRTY